MKHMYINLNYLNYFKLLKFKKKYELLNIHKKKYYRIYNIDIS